MPEKSDFVTKHDFVKANGKIYERINEIDRKHTESLGELKVKVETQTIVQKQSYEVQKDTNANIKNLTRVMTDVSSEMKDIKYKVQGHDEKIEVIQGVIDTKIKGSSQIITTLITTTGGVIVAAIGVAKFFF
ncbi:hypothetical protein [Staphylococcus aureus]|uniref:hypothetical protein n=1 Tax=Staphylococcus aureus TaxID=1280 RepID=UPI00044F7CF7|nr:hypothetical protein [Staphylococcus aureus]EZY61445.1 hypothetical protein V060_02288 [Staphylococcus aureus R0294]EZY62932.1 hypothetical protein V061_01662 [Staphylococcus aureus R0353]EZY64217.1 hypothetical protein V062_02524 [Staphylococcus aureus R0357]EZY69400.1 hypothetical protein V064_02466 [Staphylococcus aureus R0545]EZY72527.1 hypothetical protein V065_02526 [Staphylococcus aureus R0611]